MSDLVAGQEIVCPFCGKDHTVFVNAEGHLDVECNVLTVDPTEPRQTL